MSGVVLDASLVNDRKAAKAAYDREYRARNREKIREAKKLWGQSAVKKAYDKEWAEKNRERSNGIKKAWKERNPDADHEYYLRNSEAIKQREKDRHASNPEIGRERAKAWHHANPDRARESHTAYYNDRRHEFIARARARKTKLAFATPSWADQVAIAAIYRRAGDLGMHVDHVIPLQGKTVCGLHVETNMQLLTPAENLSKGNRYE